MSHLSRLWLFALAWLTLAGCGPSPTNARIGVKSFAEQRVVAQLVRQLLAARGDVRSQIIDCGDTYGCQQALRRGRIDWMTEYSGTAALYLGLDPDASPEQLQEAYAAQDLVWGKSYGFDNSYQLAMTSGRAAALEVTSIADLATIYGLRVACPRTYLRRPGDGLAALLARHGLRMRGEPLIIDDPVERLQALQAGRADVAVVYGTDGALGEANTVLLEDTLEFFPDYRAAPLVRQEALGRVRGLSEVLDTLAGRLDDEAMRELNTKVELQGWRPADAARQFLVQKELVDTTAPGSHRLDLVVAVPEGENLEAAVDRATLALRKVFSDRAIKLVRVPDPSTTVARGDARLAVVGAERFFERRQGRLIRTRRLEAVAVVGSRMVHLVRRDSAAPWEGAIGIPPRDSGGGRIAAAVMEAVDQTPAEEAPPAQLLEKVRSGELAGALIVEPPGSAVLSEALSGQLALVPLPRPPRHRLPFLRPARIAANTYPGQAQPVDSMSAQVLLAGPSRRGDPTGLRGGPAAAMLVEATPLTLEEAELLSSATGIAELPDPVLPATWSNAIVQTEEEETVSESVVDTLLNALVIAFCGWLVILLLTRRGEVAEALPRPPESQPAEEPE